MNVRRNLVAVAVATVLGTAPFAALVRADTSPAAVPAATSTVTPAATANADAAASGDPAAVVRATSSAAADAATTTPTSPILKTAEQAGRAMREIHQARLALFEGETDTAARLVADANLNLASAHDLLPGHALDMSGKAAGGTPKGEPVKAKGGDGESWLPIQTNVSLAEGFVPVEQHKGALEEADKKMAKGDEKGAVESLRLADVEIAVSAVVLPLENTTQHVEKAARMLANKQYFEAGLQLKAAEDSVVVEIWDAAAIPVQGTSDATAPAGATVAPAPKG